MNTATIVKFLETTLHNCGDRSQLSDDNIQPSARKIKWHGELMAGGV